ncbi:sigma-54 dependent transcriptional regulator [Fundidesulfovibrio butyratiphilus]
MPGKTILFVAQAHAVTALSGHFKEAGIEAGIAESLAGALAFVKKTRPSLIFSQAKIGGVYQASSLLAAGREETDFPPVVVFTARGNAEEARQLLEQGAKDYWLEPLDWEKILAVLPDDEPEETPPTPAVSPPPKGVSPPAPATNGRPTPAAPVQGQTGERFAIIGAHPAILRVLALAKQVARSRATVLISGESGTGKEMFARYLHAHSDRAGKPFVALNCAALPEHLLESELFGHEKGAFTGAIARKLGKFELAAGGTILLDEISEMDLGLQAKLLRVLQEGEFDRVGGVETVKVDVRVLATTNRRLEQYVEEGKFRQDLYYRLNVIPLKLPALSERGQDVLRLAGYFVDKYRKAYGLPKLAFSDEAIAWLTSYDWPGNVRELQNLMERAVLLAGAGPITKAHFLLEGEEAPLYEDIPEEPAVLMERVSSVNAEGQEEQPGDAGQAGQGQAAFLEGVVPLDVLERQMILKSLDQTSGNRTQAAQLLGISVRTLRNKLNEYRQLGLNIP